LFHRELVGGDACLVVDDVLEPLREVVGNCGTHITPDAATPEIRSRSFDSGTADGKRLEDPRTRGGPLPDRRQTRHGQDTDDPLAVGRFDIPRPRGQVTPPILG
jgi:hypothetical protein